jgi:hypothetical protein
MEQDDADEDRISFCHIDGFQPAAPTAGLQLGPLELQYQELFAEVLEDGIITPEERARLARAADNLGLDRERLARLEEAMTAAYEVHHRVQVVDESRRPQQSLSPLRGAPPLSRTPSPPTRPAPSISAVSSPELEQLKLENMRLKTRIAQLEDELIKAQAAVNVEADLSAFAVDAGATLSPDDAWKRVRQDPTNVEAVRHLRDAFDRSGDLDGKYLATQVLFVLGAAQPEEAAFVEAHRPAHLVAPRRAIDETMWRTLLLHPEEEASTGAIFSLVAPAILVGRVTTLRRDGQLHVPPREALHDPSKSTVMAVRALHWAGALLGLPTPQAFTEPERDSGYLHVAGIPPVTVLGASALRGKSAPELAFLVGRHMTGYRGEHFVRTLFTSTEDLEDLFLAALLVANHRLPIGGAKGERVLPMARAIAPLLDPGAIDRLKSAYGHFAEEGGRTNLQRWSQATQKTSARVGLALCQDLWVARDLLVNDEGARGPLFLDLLSYSTSEKFRTLRRQLGLDLNTTHS